ncbi:MAG: RluA family pseudouridine synthase [Treponema sp.]|jgi:23S rRNA pseudouridine955/2504/2580 synthase|nr:RluA family pseudouridine synthase [Treponema sp.]
MKGYGVLYEDGELLVLDKPAGLSVQGGKGITISLDELLARDYHPRPHLVHRLDRDTSGVLLTAKSPAAAARCAAFFDRSSGGLVKRYAAVCAGILPEKGVITGAIPAKGRRPGGRELPARTNYTRLGLSSAPGPFSLAELVPATGRMHQIRRHLAGTGCPILGDDRYGDFTLNRELKKSFGLKRMLLHARSLYLPDPLVRGGREITAPLPDYFKNFLEFLKIRPDFQEMHPALDKGNVFFS